MFNYGWNDFTEINGSFEFSQKLFLSFEKKLKFDRINRLPKFSTANWLTLKIGCLLVICKTFVFKSYHPYQGGIRSHDP
jgi:hypothetical protein